MLNRLVVGALLCIALPALAEEPFGKYTGTMVILNQNTGKRFYINEEAARVRRSPCSTFKIPNSLFGLESGYLSNANHLIKFDPKLKEGASFWMDVWSKDHTLESAFANSVVWFYQNVARNIGRKRMQEFLQTAKYGNQDISGGIDQFWLSSSLQISAEEQVDFLHNLFTSKLGFTQKNIDSLHSIMLAETIPEARIYAKTGTCRLNEKQYGGWWVGMVETASNRYYFASYLLGDNFEALLKDRKEITKTILAKHIR